MRNTIDGIIIKIVDFHIGVLFIILQMIACVMMNKIKITNGRIQSFRISALFSNDSSLITYCNGTEVILLFAACCVKSFNTGDNAVI